MSSGENRLRTEQISCLLGIKGIYEISTLWKQTEETIKILKITTADICRSLQLF